MRKLARHLRKNQPSYGSEDFTGSCPIREHTDDGNYVGRCDYATYKGECPRHGVVEDYPTHDDRDLPIPDRRWPQTRE